MATQEYRIVSGQDSEIHDEPHIQGSRLTVRFIHERVEAGGLRPESVADRYDLELAVVYEALAYYHHNAEEMREIERRRERRLSEAEERTTLSPPD